MRVVIAPDSFKGTASARDAAAALADGWRAVAPDVDVDVRAMADGGEGTLDALGAAPGAAQHAARVSGPDSRAVDAAWVMLVGPGGPTAVIELAQSSAITSLDAPTPMDAHTLGLGETIAAALDAGARRLLVAVGGSASTDGGSGALRALGARFVDAAGAEVALGARGLESLDRVTLDGLVALPPGGVAVLTDVANPLAGPCGAAVTYGPQKGASADQIARMDAALAGLARLVSAQWPERAVDPDAPGMGAAGGTAYGLAVWGAQLTPGAAAVADAVGLDAALARADLIVTGEGRFDGQSWHGKVVSEVSRRAAAAGVPVALVAGSIDAPVGAFAAAVSLTDLAGSSRAARTDALAWLRGAGRLLARMRWSMAPVSGSP
nr:glycerate kinase [Demequina sp. NBRC 110053]